MNWVILAVSGSSSAEKIPGNVRRPSSYGVPKETLFSFAASLLPAGQIGKCLNLHTVLAYCVVQPRKIR